MTQRQPAVSTRRRCFWTPYAKAIGRPLRWADQLFGYKLGDKGQDQSMDKRDSAAYAPLGIVIDPAFDWGGDTPPGWRWRETIIYETHVKGVTQRHPEVPEKLRGKYAGLASDAAIAHLKKLGITAVELMPIHHFVQDRTLLQRGLTNYWGYNTLGCFAPEPRYASADRITRAVAIP
jgi:glycogen operon protein